MADYFTFYHHWKTWLSSTWPSRCMISLWPHKLLTTNTTAAFKCRVQTCVNLFMGNSISFTTVLIISDSSSQKMAPWGDVPLTLEINKSKGIFVSDCVVLLFVSPEISGRQPAFCCWFQSWLQKQFVFMCVCACLCVSRVRIIIFFHLMKDEECLSFSLNPLPITGLLCTVAYFWRWMVHRFKVCACRLCSENVTEEREQLRATLRSKVNVFTVFSRQ